MKFAELNLLPDIIKSIDEMGFDEATEVQSETIPLILENNDLIVMSKTGSGKTGAFGLPIIQKVDGNAKLPQALILTPTRELAVQVDSEIKNMSKYTKISTTAVYGSHGINGEIDVLKKGVSIVTGTPGRVFDHIERKTLKTGEIKFLVLDEADRMLDMGFIDQVIKIIKALPKERVTLLFSATMPTEIQRICQRYMNEPKNIELGTDTKTVDSIEQSYYRVNRDEKRLQLHRLLTYYEPDSCMVFCNTKIEVDRVHQYLERKGYATKALHGDKQQSARMKSINHFKKGSSQVLVATDVAARGIHIDDLSIVINYDLPQDKDNYVHRIGRSGRAGKDGRAVSLVTSNDVMDLYSIEEHVGALIEEEPLPTDEEIKQHAEEVGGKWIAIREENLVKIANRKKSHYKENKNERHHKGHSDHQKRNKPHHKHKNEQGVKPSHNKAEPKAYASSKGKADHKQVKKQSVIPQQGTTQPKVQTTVAQKVVPKVTNNSGLSQEQLAKINAKMDQMKNGKVEKKSLIQKVLGIFKN